MESNGVTVAGDVPDFLMADLAGKTCDRVDIYIDFPLLSHPVCGIHGVW